MTGMRARFAAALVLTIAPLGGALALEPGVIAPAVWVQFATHEEKALRDYRWLMTSNDVIDNGRDLRALAKSEEFTKQYRNCGAAAQTLSYMVTGYYFSARRLAVSTDWHVMSGDYARQRAACLSDLRLDERDYPLPGWFGR